MLKLRHCQKDSESYTELSGLGLYCLSRGIVVKCAFQTGNRTMHNTTASDCYPTSKSLLVDTFQKGPNLLSSEVYKNISDAFARVYATQKDACDINREALKSYQAIYNKRVSKTWHTKFRAYVDGAAMAFNPLPPKWYGGKYHVFCDFNSLSNDMRLTSDDINNVLVAVVRLRDRYKTK
jgi:hypothetical protein